MSRTKCKKNVGDPISFNIKLTLQLSYHLRDVH
jgi:hypothetical protein